LVSHAATGSLTVDPTRRLLQAKARGLKLIIVDPRVTETARQATLAVQPIPGHDAGIAGALIRTILDAGWHDADFCAAHVGEAGMAELRAAVEPLTESFIEGRAGLPVGLIRKVAELFARDNRRGGAFTGTGPSMARHSNLMQHLVDTLNVICGRFPRANEVVTVDPQNPPYPLLAEVIPPARAWEAQPPSRIRGIGGLFGERMTGTLPEQILTPGKGQIRCMIVCGGNPVAAVPDTARMVEALRSLDVLVTVDPYMTATARMSHYILPPKMQYERPDIPLNIPGFSIFPDPWGQYTPSIVQPPAGSEVVDDWYPFWAIAKRLGFSIDFAGKGSLPVDVPPTTDDLIRIRMKGARVTFEEMQRHPHGHLFDAGRCIVQPGRSDVKKRFDVMPADVQAELVEYLEMKLEPQDIRSSGRRFTHLLSSRRIRDAFNSYGTTLEPVRKRNPCGAAYLHPADLQALGVAPNELVELESDHGRIRAVAAADPGMRPGVVALSHSWGGLPEDDFEGYANPNLLIACDRDVETVDAMPRMSAIPVNVRKVAVPA